MSTPIDGQFGKARRMRKTSAKVLWQSEEKREVKGQIRTKIQPDHENRQTAVKMVKVFGDPKAQSWGEFSQRLPPRPLPREIATV